MTKDSDRQMLPPHRARFDREEKGKIKAEVGRMWPQAKGHSSYQKLGQARKDPPP